MKYRTDLAVEIDDMLMADRQNAAGYTKSESRIDEDIMVTEIRITTDEGEKLFGRQRGIYTTIEIQGVLEEKNDIVQRASRALAEELKKLIKFDYFLKALVVGLGNEKVTPDSLGPHTVDKVKITSHLFKIFECDGDWEMANVCGLNPSVTGVTGIETAELIRLAAEYVKPDVVIAVDSLAAREMSRMSTTVQLCDTGIAPGAGMGNNRKEINRESLGCKVIAIGVPTVIDSRTLLLEAAEETGNWDVETYIRSREMDMIVTSTDIDQIIKIFSEIIANAINITLHPGIYS